MIVVDIPVELQMGALNKKNKAFWIKRNRSGKKTLALHIRNFMPISIYPTM